MTHTTYFSNAGRTLLNQERDNGVIYIGAVHPSRFKIPLDIMKTHVRRKGSSAVLFREESQEALVQHYAEMPKSKEDR